jgi:hypothetical protein
MSMVKTEKTVITSFAIPQSLLEKVRSISINEDLNLSILFRKMVREWLGEYEYKNGKRREVDCMNL